MDQNIILVPGWACAPDYYGAWRRLLKNIRIFDHQKDQMDQMDFRSTIVIGHSYGFLCALRAKHPPKILIGLAGFTCFCPNNHSKNRLRTYGLSAMIHGFGMINIADFYKKCGLSSWSTGPMDFELLKEQLEDMRISDESQKLRQWIEEGTRCLAIATPADLVVDEELTLYCFGQQKGVDLRWIHSVSHGFPITHCEQTIQLIRSWI